MSLNAEPAGAGRATGGDFISSANPTLSTPLDRPQLKDTYRAAEQYAKLGISIVPIQRLTKEPPAGFRWSEFTRRIADSSERFSWFQEHDYQIAVIAGLISGNLVPLDFDSETGFESLASLYPKLRDFPRVRTGSGRNHVWIRTPRPVKKYVTRAPDGTPLEIRAGTHYSLCPPSLHPNGTPYTWEIDPVNVGIPIIELEDIGLKSINPSERSEAEPIAEGTPLTTDELEEISRIVEPDFTEGKRYNLTLALAGWLAYHNVPETDVQHIVTVLIEGIGHTEYRENLFRAVRDTFKKARSGVAVAGWSVLTSRDYPLVGPSAAKRLDLLLKYRDPVLCFDPPAGAIERKSSGPWLIDAADFLDEPDEPDDWAIEGILRHPSVTLAVGPGKTYKSFFVLGIAIAIATGTRFLDAFPVAEPRAVLYVQEESARRYLRKRLHGILAGLGLHKETLRGQLHLMTNQGFRLDQPEQIERLVAEGIERYDARVVILDPLRELHHQDENKAESMLPILQALKRIRDEYQASIVVVHHNNKNPEYSNPADSIRGSTAIWAAMDGGYFFGTTKDDNRMRIRTILKEGGQPDPFLYWVDDDNGAIVLQTAELEETGKTLSDEAIIQAVKDAIGWNTAETLSQLVGLSVKRLRPRLNALAGQGRIQRREVRNPRKTYQYASVGTGNDDPDF